MDEWFQAIATESALPEQAALQLRDEGYVVLEEPSFDLKPARLSEAYDAAVSAAHPDDVRRGSTSTRISDFVNRGSVFDALYLYRPLLGACCQVIDRPFKLSTMHARTLEPGVSAQSLHVDFKRYDEGWPMVGFIIMVDDFRNDNGATRFVPGSHLMAHAPTDALADATTDYEGQGLACGRAGSMVIYNGSIWHGHTANRSAAPRRSIQGAFIRREDQSGANLPSRMLPETLARITDLAKYLLALELC